MLAGFGAGGLAAALNLWWPPALIDTTPRALMGRTLLEFAPALLVYLVVAVYWSLLLAAVGPGGWRMALACLPVLSMLWIVIAFARRLRGLDELQQRIELQAVAGGAALVAGLCTAAGFLGAGGALRLPDDAGIWVFPALAGGTAWAARR